MSNPGCDKAAPLALKVEGLACHRGARRLFAGLDFDLGPGEALLVRGANGSGKTTLLRMVAGFVPPEVGHIERPEGAPLGYLGHRDGLKPGLTALENMRAWRGLLGGKADRIEPAMRRTGVAALADLPTRFLSAGQRRRLALARLIAFARPIWVLDEPEAALDDAGQDLLAGLMAEHRADGGLLLVASHRLKQLEGAAVLELGGGA